VWWFFWSTDKTEIVTANRHLTLSHKRIFSLLIIVNNGKRRGVSPPRHLAKFPRNEISSASLGWSSLSSSTNRYLTFLILRSRVLWSNTCRVNRDRVLIDWRLFQPILWFQSGFVSVLEQEIDELIFKKSSVDISPGTHFWESLDLLFNIFFCLRNRPRPILSRLALIVFSNVSMAESVKFQVPEFLFDWTTRSLL
jgi:hypothetical protein